MAKHAGVHSAVIKECMNQAYTHHLLLSVLLGNAAIARSTYHLAGSPDKWLKLNVQWQAASII